MLRALHVGRGIPVQAGGQDALGHDELPVATVGLLKQKGAGILRLLLLRLCVGEDGYPRGR